MNKVTLLGALALTPDLRFTAGGMAILSGVIAGERHITDYDGQARTIPFYSRFQVLGKYAELIAERKLQAGQVVMAEGQLDYSEWEKDGSKHSQLRTKITGTLREVCGDFELTQDSAGTVRLQGKGVNQVEIVGNLGRDVELRHTPAGDAVAEISVAVTENFIVNGAKRSKTHWVNAVLWRQNAQAIAHMKKGDSIFIQGATYNDKYTDKEGNKRQATKIEVVHAYPLARYAPTASATAEGQREAQPKPTAPDFSIEGVDLPF